MAEQDRIQWQQAGTTEADLADQLQKIYWEALEAELADGILSLQWILQMRESHPSANIGPADITDRVPLRLGPPMWSWNPLGLELEEIVEHLVPEAMEYAREQQDQVDEFLLARYILCGLGLLDIDEIVEYLPPVIPSQNGPPRFSAKKVGAGDTIEISTFTCDACNKPLRGMAWSCRAGCTPLQTGKDGITTDFMVCMPCYHKGEHPRRHLVQFPHSYAIPPSLQAELSPDSFWALRREIQQQQSAIDVKQDRAEKGYFKSSLIQTITPISRALFPLGNIHSSIMFGPLMFEIGVPDSNGGVRISCRQPPALAKNWSSFRKAPALAINHEREIFKAQLKIKDRPIQTAVKQVVSGMFSGYFSDQQVLEDFIGKMVLAGAKGYKEHPLRSRDANRRALLKMTRNVIGLLKLMMGSQVKLYLQIFARVLFDKTTDLRWSQYSNNCQKFCDAIIHQPEFSAVFPRRMQLNSTPESEGYTLDYLLSFRTDEQLGDMIEQSRLSIGPISTFFKQLHNPTNVIEAQADPVRQGAEGSPSLCARLLGWNCQSEDCNLIDHLWTNPPEFISMLQLHLLLGRNHYVRERSNEGDIPAPLDDVEWIQNRVAVLQTIDCFVTSAASLSRTFKNRLSNSVSATWGPPPPYCIPQDWPFFVEGDKIQMTQQDMPSEPSMWNKLFSRQDDRPQIDLQGISGAKYKVKVIEPTLRAQ